MAGFFYKRYNREAITKPIQGNYVEGIIMSKMAYQ